MPAVFSAVSGVWIGRPGGRGGDRVGIADWRIADFAPTAAAHPSVAIIVADCLRLRAECDGAAASIAIRNPKSAIGRGGQEIVVALGAIALTWR